MTPTVEFVLKLKDLLSGGMRGAASVTQTAMSGIQRNTGRATSSISDMNRRLDELRRTRELSVDMRQIRTAGREIERLERQRDRLEGTGRRSSGGMMGSIIGGNLIAGGIMQGAGMIQNLVGDSVRKGLEAVKTQTAFQVMAGNKGGNELYGNLTGYARESIYGNEVYKNAQTMLGFGIQAQKVMPTMKMLGDIAMGDADKLGSLTLAFSQVQSAGKLQGQDLLQLINAGFNPLGIMAEKTGKSIGVLRSEMEKGHISARMVEDAFKSATGPGGRFFDMTERIAQTPFGKWQALQGQVEGMKTSFGTVMLPFIGALTDAGAHLLNFLDISRSVPEQMRIEQAETNSLVQSIVSLNEGNAARGRMLDILKSKQPEMFGNLDAEKFKNSELLSILQNVNQAYKDRIELATYKVQETAYKGNLGDLYQMQTTARAALSDPSLLTTAAAAKMIFSDVPYERPLFGHGKEELQDFINKSQQMIDYNQEKLATTQTKSQVSEMQQKMMQLAKYVYHQQAAPGWKAGDQAKASKELSWYMDASKQKNWLPLVSGHDMGTVNGLLTGATGGAAIDKTLAGFSGSSGGGTAGASNGGTTSAAGGRVIVVNINKEMIGAVTINSQGTGAGIDDIEPKLTEMLMRVLNSANATQDN